MIGGEAPGGVPTASTNPSAPAAGGAVTALIAGTNISLSGAVGNVTVTGTGNVAVASHAALLLLDCTNLSEGAVCLTESLKSMWDLLPSTAAAINFVNVAALNKAGFQWVRRMVRNPVWEVQAAWTVDPQNGAASDDNAGTAGAPLATLTELSRRLTNAVLANGSTIAVTLASSCATTDKPTWSFSVQPGAAAGTGLVVTGTPSAPLYTGSLTSAYVQQVPTVATATDNEIIDSAIPVSYTASGLLASGLIYQRTNGAACYWFALKDLGSKTLRISDPINAAASSITTLASGDTYTVSQLPKIFDQAYVRNTGRIAYVTFAFCDDNTTQSAAPILTPKWDPVPVIFDRCSFSTARLLGNCRMKNCLITGSVSMTSFGLVRMDGGAIRGPTSILVTNGALFDGTLTVHLQGCSLSVSGTNQGANALAFYDCPTDCLVCVSQAGFVLGVIKGKGNAGKLLRCSDFMATIGYNTSVAPPVVAGSSSDPLPIQCGNSTVPGTSIAPASLPLVAEIGTRMLAVVAF